MTMERLSRAAIVTSLAGRLREAGSWCGETHIQKAFYLLQDMLGVSTDFQFILYKHGPFSFDLSDELTALRGDKLLTLEPQTPPYGPRYARTEMSDRLEEAFRRTVGDYEKQLQFVAEVVDGRTVADLERLATALYVTKRREAEHDNSVKERALCLNRLKPHVTFEAATKAVEEIDRLIGRLQETATG
jgi:uncharacterized protein YwgA